MALDNYEIEFFRDNQGVPEVRLQSNEPHVIYDSQIILTCLPSETAESRVIIFGMTEIDISEEISSSISFKVDYNHGVVYFHEGLEGNSINVTYYGKGKKLFYDSRIKLTDEEGNWDSSTLSQFEKELAEKYRATQFLSINEPTTVKEQNIQTIVAKEGTTIPNQYLKLGTMIVVY